MEHLGLRFAWQRRDDAEVFGERWPYARLRLLGIATGKVSTVEAIGERHVAEAAPEPSGTSLAVVSWPTPELDNWARENEVHEVSLDDLAARPVGRLGADVYELGWGKPGQEGARLLALAAGPGGVGEAVLYEVPLDPNSGEPHVLGGAQPPTRRPAPLQGVVRPVARQRGIPAIGHPRRETAPLRRPSPG